MYGACGEAMRTPVAVSGPKCSAPRRRIVLRRDAAPVQFGPVIASPAQALLNAFQIIEPSGSSAGTMDSLNRPAVSSCVMKR